MNRNDEIRSEIDSAAGGRAILASAVLIGLGAAFAAVTWVLFG